MNTFKNIHGGGSDTIPVKDKDKNKPKLGKDPVLEAAEFFERLDRHRPRKVRVITSFSRR
jgi:hypothetical protein